MKLFPTLEEQAALRLQKREITRALRWILNQRSIGKTPPGHIRIKINKHRKVLEQHPAVQKMMEEAKQSV